MTDFITFAPLSNEVVSLTAGFLPAWSACTAFTFASTSSWVSLLMVEYCVPCMMSFTDSGSESWPVTIGFGFPADLTDVRIARASVSFGDRTPSSSVLL